MQANKAQSIKLLLIDDHVMFRQGLANVLEEQPNLKVVGQFGCASEALAALDHVGAGMVLLDVDLGPERALDFVVAARKQDFEGHILVVTAGMSGQEAVQLIQAGVSGILHKHHSTEELCETIRQVAGGDVYLEKDYVASLYRSADKSKTRRRRSLTDRDKTVLRLILQGLSNRDIGVRLNISESGAKSCLRQLFDKLGVRTRAQVVKVALEDYRDQL